MRWLTHAIVDAALGVGLLIAGVHGSGADYLVLDAAGGYLILATVVTDGPLGLWRHLGRLPHRVLDVAVALGLIASPLIAWRAHVPLELFATAMAEAVGVIVLRDGIVTDHRDLRRRPAKDGPQPIETTAREPGASPAASLEAGLGEAARRAGALAGRAKRRAAKQ